jgi:hypothetical protein
VTQGLKTIKLPRTIRLDPSDTFVFRQAAEPGEWAVSGAFLFSQIAPETLQGPDVDPKARAAFRSGFLGIASFGWSTLVVVTEATEVERVAAVEQLAKQFVERLGAPDMIVARAAATEELAFAASLCDHPPQTLLALARAHEDGALAERFRTLTPRGDRPRAGLTEGFRAFEFIESDAEGPEIEESVDLMALGEKREAGGTT